MTNKKNQARFPVVTFMGHIDHGKTSILDKIRSTNVFGREAGGITQHIGAYQAKDITFIDTPGHAAFTAMRQRGAQITDIVVLVIAATEGVMPQTKESIKHIKEANLPFIVAMNKIDLETASPEKVKGQLVELDITPEDYGGQVAVVPVSAKTGEGIDKLLELIHLNAEIMELKAEPQLPVEAFIIESRLDKSRGPVASLIVKKGTLNVGDTVYAEDILCKIKAMIDYAGNTIKTAGPSTPVELLGFEKVPAVGTLVTPDQQEKSSPEEVLDKTKIVDDEDNPKLKIILKADMQGTLEALKNTFSDEVIILSQGIGAVTDNDIFMAQTSNAQIFAFNVKTHKQIVKLAQTSKVKLFESKIIYEIIENIQNQVLKILEPTIDENITGEGSIEDEFKIDKVRIAGLVCNKGEIKVGDTVHLQRAGKIIKDTKVEGIRQGKEVVDKVKAGNDCGITFKPYVDFKLKDVIMSYNKN
jgi:translation initiation factor IF-2